MQTMQAKVNYVQNKNIMNNVRPVAYKYIQANMNRCKAQPGHLSDGYTTCAFGPDVVDQNLVRRSDIYSVMFGWSWYAGGHANRTNVKKPNPFCEQMRKLSTRSFLAFFDSRRLGQQRFRKLGFLRSGKECHRADCQSHYAYEATIKDQYGRYWA